MPRTNKPDFDDYFIDEGYGDGPDEPLEVADFPPPDPDFFDDSWPDPEYEDESPAEAWKESTEERPLASNWT